MKHLDVIGADGCKSAATVDISFSSIERALTNEAILDGFRLDRAEHHRSYLAVAMIAYPDKTMRQLIDSLP